MIVATTAAMTTRTTLLAAATGAALAATAFAAQAAPADDVVRRAMTDELARTMKDLHIPNEARPYHVTYTLTDVDEAFAQGTFGATSGSNQRRRRTLRVDLRVGDQKVDSGNFFSPSQFFLPEAGMAIPVEDDYVALRRELWLRTDEAFKRALESLSRKRAAEKGRGKGEQDAPIDFAAAKTADTVVKHPGAEAPLDLASLTKTTRTLSALFREYPEIHTSLVTGRHFITRTRVLTSDGSWKDESRSVAELFVSASTQADDGMTVRSWVPIGAHTLSGLPPLPGMEKVVRQMAAEVTAAKTAPIPDGGNAVVLFEPRAAGQLLRRLLGDHLSGTPPPATASDDGPPSPVPSSDLATKLGQKIGPSFLQAFDDPRGTLGPMKAPVYGGYGADDEAIPAQKLSLIENGVLRGLYMSRTPRKQILQSNGHGRGAPQAGAVRGRIGVLTVSAGKAGLGEAALRARALQEAKAGGADTPLYIVRHIDSTVTVDQDGPPSSFMGGPRRGNPGVRPLVVFRLRNGKEEPVRGISFTNLLPRALKDIAAMGKTPVVYNFIERTPGEGSTDGTVIAPAVLFRDVEVRRDTEKQPKPPLYAHPFFPPGKTGSR